MASTVGASSRRLLRSFILIFAVALGLVATSSVAAPSDALTRYSYTQYHMGVDARLVVYAPNQTTAEDACAAAFARIAALDSIMSDYRRDSELNRLCARAGGRPVRISPDLFRVFKQAQRISRLSDGAFDITAAPVIQLWRKARKTGKLPDPVELEKARKLVGWQKLVLNEKARTARLTTPGMKLDLGGIAKGYAGDEAQKVLKKHGITRALVEMGGDIVVSEAPPGREGWTIRVPNAGDARGPKDLRFTNCAVSTSGDTVQFVLIGGRRYSHVVDPRTGQALTNRVQATVVAPDGLTSDPLSKIMALLEAEGVERFKKAFPQVRFYVRVLPAGSDGEDAAALRRSLLAPDDPRSGGSGPGPAGRDGLSGPGTTG